MEDTINEENDGVLEEPNLIKMEKVRRNHLITQKRKAFVDEYLHNGKDGVEAYKKVYPNVTQSSAQVLSYNLLRRDDVQNLIAKSTIVLNTNMVIERNFIKEQYIELLNACKKAKDRTNTRLTLDTLREFIEEEKASRSDMKININFGMIVQPKSSGFDDDRFLNAEDITIDGGEE
jgi:hypothetical protein